MTVKPKTLSRAKTSVARKAAVRRAQAKAIPSNRSLEELNSLARFPDENPNPVLRISSDGLVLYANRASGEVLRAWGCEVGERLPRAWQEIVRQAYRADISSEVELLAAGKILSCALTPIAGLGYSNIYCRDITQQKLAAQALQESEEKFKFVFDHLLIGKSITHPDGRIEVNRAFCDMLGYSSAELRDRSWQDITHPDDTRMTERILASIQAGEQDSARFEKRYLKKDGSVVWADVSTAARREPDGRVRYFMTSVSDITEHKRAEAELRASEQRYRSLFENMRTGYAHCHMLYTPDGQPEDFLYLKVNPAFEKLTGIHGATGRKVSDVIPGIRQSNPELFEIYGRVARTSVPEHFETYVEALGIWFSISVYSPQPGDFVAVFENITGRKQAEEALRSSKAQLDAALKSMTDAVFISDAAGNFIEFNDAFATFHKFPNKAECAKTLAEYPAFLDVFLPGGELAPLDMWAVPRALRGETATNAEYSLRRKDTGETWVGSYSFAPIRDDAGAIVGSVVVGRDITDHKRSEDAVRLSEAKFRTVFMTSPDAITITGLQDGKYVLVNEGFTRIFGYDEVDVVGKTSLDIQMWAVPEERKPFAEALRRDGIVREFEARLRCKAGSILDTLVSATQIAFDGTPHILSVTRDVTERKRVLEALQLENERFQRFVDSNVVGIRIAAADGKVLVANDYYLGLLGRTRREFEAGLVDWRKLTPDEWLSADEKAIAELREHGVCAPYEKEYRRPDGTRVPVLLADALLPGPGEQMVAFVLDITERKRAESALREYTEELRRSNADLEQFAYVASHDLQEPLRMVASYTQLLSRRYTDKLDAEAQEFIQYAVDGANRMQVLINDLLAYSRVSTRARPPQVVDASALLGQAIANLHQAIQDSHGLITNTDLPEVTGDPTQLGQLLQNLLGNALKFRSADPPRIHVAAQLEGPFWRFSVRDNGIGLDPQFAERIFVIFQRLHARDEYPGTGIGLALCKKIVERHGGRIWVESQPGAGATFYFTLPAVSSNGAVAPGSKELKPS